jgi:tRNA pseudouridine synthase 10
MCNILGEGDSSSSESMESELKPEVCRICLGILQFIYRDEKEMLVKRKNGDELAASIAELTRQEGHQIDGFSLEVSIPPIIFENEQAVRSDF